MWVKALGQGPHCPAQDTPPGCPQGPSSSFSARVLNPPLSGLCPLLDPDGRGLAATRGEEAGAREAVRFPGGGAVGALGHVQSLRWSDSASGGHVPRREAHLDRVGSDAYLPAAAVASSLFLSNPKRSEGWGAGRKGQERPSFRRAPGPPPPTGLPRGLPSRCKAGEEGAGTRRGGLHGGCQQWGPSRSFSEEGPLWF